jgi:predicted glycosyltransferase
VWFDFENTPHVLFLGPLIAAITRAGFPVRITAKPQAQTLELAEARGFTVEPVGGGDFVGYPRKIAGGLARAVVLAAWGAKRGRPRLLVASSRSASLAAWLLRVRSVALLDYEHSDQQTLALGSALWLPDLLRGVRLPRRSRRIAQYYRGLKENLYLDGWIPDREAERRALGVSAGDILVVARPPHDAAHYASPASGRYWLAVVDRLLHFRDTRVLVIARAAAQRHELQRLLAGRPRVEFVGSAVFGPALVAAADLVLGAGGTMNREAAVLGVPVWSTFSGMPPHIDERLAAEGRLRWVRSEADLDAALADWPPRACPPRGPFPEGLAAISGDILARLGIVGEDGVGSAGPASVPRTGTEPVPLTSLENP